MNKFLVPLKNLYWTNHSKMKMSFYNISEKRVKRVLKTPKRIEEGVAKNTIAIMQPTITRRRGGKETWSQEIWVMFQKAKNKLKIISAWRYPGKAPERHPIPKEILNELREEGLI